MASAVMKRVRFEVFPCDGGLWGYVVRVDKKEVASETGFLTEKDAGSAGYKEKQRQVNLLQRIGGNKK